MDPITQGAIFGAITLAVLTPNYIPLPKRLRRTRIHPIIIGSVGGGIGGWMSTELWTNPSSFNVFLGSIVGLTVFSYCIGLIRN